MHMSVHVIAFNPIWGHISRGMYSVYTQIMVLQACFYQFSQQMLLWRGGKTGTKLIGKISSVLHRMGNKKRKIATLHECVKSNTC